MDPKVLFLLFMFLIESHGEIIDVIDYRQQTLDELLKDRQATLTLAGKVSDPLKKENYLFIILCIFLFRIQDNPPPPRIFKNLHLSETRRFILEYFAENIMTIML